MEVNEAFLVFVELSRTDVNSGQGNDGCSTMSGEVSGVQKRIKTIYPTARYYLQLQLVILNSCKNVIHIGDTITILA